MQNAPHFFTRIRLEQGKLQFWTILTASGSRLSLFYIYFKQWTRKSFKGFGIQGKEEFLGELLSVYFLWVFMNKIKTTIYRASMNGRNLSKRFEVKMLTNYSKIHGTCKHYLCFFHYSIIRSKNISVISAFYGKIIRPIIIAMREWSASTSLWTISRLTYRLMFRQLSNKIIESILSGPRKVKTDTPVSNCK